MSQGIEKSLSDISELLASDKPRIRLNGYGHLKALLENQEVVPYIRKYFLTDVIVIITKFVEKDLRHWNPGDANAASSEMLTMYADLLRKQVDQYRMAFRRDQITMLLDHLVGSLKVQRDTSTYGQREGKQVVDPMEISEESYICTPVLAYYSKSINLICQLPFHLDHLSHRAWRRCVLRICKALELLVLNSSRINAPMFDLFSSLQLLIDHRPQAVSDTTVRTPLVLFIESFLSTYPVGTNCHALAYSCLSTIIMRHSLKDTNDAGAFIALGYRYLGSHLASKSETLKEQIYLFINTTFDLMAYLIARVPTTEDDLSSSNEFLQHFLATLRVLIKVENHSVLSIDDIIFGANKRSGFLQLDLFCFNPSGNNLAWLYVSSCAKVAMLASSINFSLQAEGSSKTAGVISIPTATNIHKLPTCQDFVDMWAQYELPFNVLFYQIFTFVIHEFPVTYPHDLLEEKLLPAMYLSNNLLTTWAIVCAGCVVNRAPETYTINPESEALSQLWQKCKLSLVNEGASVASCFAANMLLDSHVLPQNSQNLYLEDFLSVWDIQVPVLSSSSLNLCKYFLRYQTTSSKITRYLSTRVLDWFVGACSSYALSSKSHNSYLNMQSAVDIYQCLCMFSGLEPMYPKEEELVAYTGTCGLQHNSYNPYYQLWAYLGLGFYGGAQQLHVSERSSNPLSVTAVAISRNEKSIAIMLINCLSSIQLKADTKNWAGVVGFLVSCSIYLSTLHKLKPDSSLLEQLSAPYEHVVESLNIAHVSPYDDSNIELLFEAIGTLNYQIKIDGAYDRLSPMLCAILERALISPPRSLLTEGYEQFVSLARFYCDDEDQLLLVDLHQREKAMSEPKVRRRSWVIINQISKMRLQFSGTSLELLLGLCDVISGGDELIIWTMHMYEYLIADLLTLDDSSFDEYQAMYRKMLRIFSKRMLESYSWNDSDIGLSLILKMVCIGFEFQNMTMEYAKQTEAFASRMAEIESDIESLLDRVFQRLRERNFRFLSQDIKLCLIKMCCLVLRSENHKALKNFERIFEWPCYDQLLQFFSEKDCLSLFHSMDIIADFLVSVRDMQFQKSLYIDFSTAFKSMTAPVDLAVLQTKFIWELAVRGFPISWLSCQLVELATIKDVEPHVEIQLGKIRDYFSLSGNLDFFKRVIPSVIDYWFEHSNSLQGFPIDLCGYESERHFFCENYVNIVSNFLLRNPKDASVNFLQMAAKLLDLSYDDLLEVTYPRAFAFLLSCESRTINGSYDALADFVQNQEMIPAPSSGVDLNHIIREIVFITDLSELSERILEREPFLSIYRHVPDRIKMPKFGSFSLDAETSEWLLGSLWKIHVGEFEKVSSGLATFNDYITQKPLLHGITINLLALNPRFADKLTKFVRVRQVMFLYHFGGPKVVPEGDPSAASVNCRLLNITLRGLLPYIDDLELCCEVCPFIIWLLRVNAKWMSVTVGADSIRPITTILSSVSRVSSKFEQVKILLNTLKHKTIPKIFEGSDKKYLKVKDLLFLLIDGHLGLSVNLVSEDILFILNSNVLEIDHFVSLIILQVAKQPDLLLQDSDMNWSVDTARAFLAKLSASSHTNLETTTQFKAWLCRVIGKNYLRFGYLKLSDKEFTTKNVSENVMVAVVHLMVDYIDTGDPQIISAAHTGIMQLLHNQSSKDSFYDDDSDDSSFDESLAVFSALPTSIQPLFEGRFKIIVPLPERNMYPLPKVPYDQWIRQICARFLPYLQQIVPSISGLQYLIDFSSDFAEKLLLVLLQKRYSEADDDTDAELEYRALLGMFLSYFLQDSVSECVDLDKKRRLVMQIICVLRVDDEIPVSDELSLVHAAKCALDIGMNKTALLFLEIDRLDLLSDASGIELSAGERAMNASRSAESKELLIRISEKIGRDDPDMKYATLNVPTLNQAISAIRGVEDENGWDRLSYESALFDSTLSWDKDSYQNVSGLARAFSNIGMYGMTELVNDSIMSSSSHLEGPDKYSYEWKIQKWDLPVSKDAGPDALVYRMFKSLSSAKYSDRRDRHSLFDQLYEEAYATKYESTEKLGILRECEEIWLLEDASAHEVSDPAMELFLKQRRRTEPWLLTKNYSDVEELLAAREISWKLRSASVASGSLKSDIDVCLSLSALDNSNYSWKFSRSHKAMVHTLQLQKLARTCFQDKPKVEDMVRRTSEKNLATVMWHMGNQSHSISKLRSVALPLPSAEDVCKRPNYWWQFYSDIEMVCDLVRWSSVARHEPFEYIQKAYLAPVRNFTDHLESFLDSNVTEGFLKEHLQNTLNLGRADVYHTYAVFCHEQYTSSDLTSEEEILETQQRDKAMEIDEAKEILTGSEARAHLAKLKAMLAYDRSRLNEVKRARSELLNLSIENYLLSISTSDKYREDTSRFFALWMENLEASDVNKKISAAIDGLPMVKLVPWINQLVSLLILDSPYSGSSRSSSLRPSNVERLVMALCREHPFHCLYQVLSLAKTPSASSLNDPKMARRKSVGTKVWDKVELTSDSGLKRIMRQMDVFASETENLVVSVNAFMESDKGSEPMVKKRKLGVKGLNSPPSIKLRSLAGGRWWISQEGLQSLRIPLPTMNIPVRADGDYSDIPIMYVAAEKLKLANGLSRPIIMSVQSSDGSSTKMVIKAGDDDLRQDSIMEQVFGHVNELLSHNDATRVRDLKIKTYKVVPLNPRLGVIEFVENAIALLDVLEALHEKYRPNDMPIETARSRMKVALTTDAKGRLETYLHIERMLKPVLGMFFLERFFSPDDWFDNQLRYTRSVAAGSILGYAIGLGDRHCRNILLDSRTGELVHIDLGIAFDQGKLLPVPETVPFRLTRDIVDGMGIMGTAGSFQRCCELTLDVLRSEISSVMTILNVLKYDPLYSWTLSPVRKLRMQWSENKDANKIKRDTPASKVSQADRALSTVKGKLSKNLSSEAVTRQLVQQASSSKNLALIYYGWSPFL